jgi:hypothetical protein
MKFYNLQYAVEAVYQQNFNFNFNCNEIQNTKLTNVYINDPRFLEYKDEYISKGYKVIDRLGESPYEKKRVEIYSLFPFKDTFPVCIDNSDSLKYMIVEKKLYVHLPEKVLGLTYNHRLTYLGLINYNINHYGSRKFES